MALSVGKAAMPALKSKRALKMFKGDEEEIVEFLNAYECCAEDVQLPRAEWVRFIFRYIYQEQRLIFEAFNGFRTEDWDTFSSFAKEVFGAF